MENEDEENIDLNQEEQDHEKPWEINGSDFDVTNFTLGGLPPDGD